MQSTGNDIVALDLINIQRSNDSRFYSRILCSSEKALFQQTVFAGRDFAYFLWLCWSVKESAYKYLKRRQPSLIFSPSRIIIRRMDIPANKPLAVLEDTKWEGSAGDEKSYSGSFLSEDTLYYFRSKIYRELIMTVVSEDEKFEHVFWGFSSIEDTGAHHQSKAVRTLLLQRLHTVLPGRELRVEKAPAGYPIIVEGTKELHFPVSFAHHGKFVAYSFLLS